MTKPPYDPEAAHEEYRRKVARYSGSFMSDAKWVRLFTAAARSGIAIARAKWAFIGTDHVMWEALPEESDLLPHRFLDGRFQPFEYRWIESIFVPWEYRPDPSVGYTRKQDVGALRRALEAVGQFQLEEDDEGLTIVAYRT